MFDTSTPSITNTFSEPLVPSNWYPPTPAVPDFPSARTPGAICSSVLNVRPRGSCSIILEVIVVAVRAEATSSTVDSAVTCTASVTPPSGSVTSTLRVWPTDSCTICDLVVWKPARVAVTW